MSLSNLPLGVTNDDIEEDAGAFDTDVLRWKGPGWYCLDDTEPKSGRGYLNYWQKTEFSEVVDIDNLVKLNSTEEWAEIVEVAQ